MLAPRGFKGAAGRLAAALYRGVIDRALDGVHRRMAHLLLETAEIPILVDCCCGTGGLLRHLARDHRAGSALGVDLNPFALAEASRAVGPGQVVALGDVRQLPLPIASVDGVGISHALHVVPSSARPAILRELARVIRPGGLVVIADYDPEGAASAFTRSSLFAIERLAGGDHYRNYRDYMASGGIVPLLEDAGLHTRRHLPIHSGGGAIWVCGLTYR